MTIADFVSHLQSLDVRLSAEGERLRLNAPQGVLTDSLRSQIAERKQELLVFVRDNRASATSTPPPVVRRTTGKPAPLSFAQERLWFLEQLEPGSPVYNICRTYRLKGKLNLFALEASLKEIERRHEILRSAIGIADGQPLQVTEPPHELKLSVVDFKAISEAERQTEMRQRIRHAAETPFDFSAGKFLRAELLRIPDDEHILILTTHHIVSDAWSMGILSRELWSLYTKYAAGKSSDLQELPIQYANFAVWQREWLQGRVLGVHVSYWKKQLKDVPILNLPNDHPRPLRQSFTGAKMSITFSESLTAAINDLSNERGVTPFMTLLAAFQVLLYRYSGQEDIVVGSPIANRCVTELEPLIGFFVNTLVLRTDLSGNPTFEELLSRVREVCLAGYEHQDLPFEKLVQELRPERDQSRNPLFQVMFALQNATQRFSPPAGLVVEPIELQSTRSPFDLSLFLRERKGKYIGYIEYSTDLFNPDRIERMAGHLQTLLEAIVADPDQSIATLPILMEAERHQILVEWNDTAADYPKEKCIHQLFEEQVEQRPDLIAVEFEDEQITYRELNRRANQLAHHLISLGIGPNNLVGICVERSIEMVLGLLGIIKAGGAYVPLDPAYPKERLCFMLEDANISVLVTQENLLDRTQNSTLILQHFNVCLDRDLPIIEQQSSENPSTQLDSNNLAYVIYTSGSTGRPKGVAIEHRNTAAMLNWASSVFTSDEIAGVLASTSICFDLAVFELFVPLSFGGKIVLLQNALCLRETAASGITLLNTVPSAMAGLLAAGPLPASVRVVNLAGEPLRSELVDQLYQTGTVDKVYDLYGPSETTTYSTFTRRTAIGPATIGRPIANTRVYLLDSHLQPVPIGVPGELCIGGAGVARSYLHRPALSAARFISDPFSKDPRARIYRTGDLARYLPDGNIEFLGRTDNQVKIRGYRIELGEIESVLSQHPAVTESVVIASSFPPLRRRRINAEVALPTNGMRKEAPLSRPFPVEGQGVSESDRNLIAYFVPKAKKPSEIELRRFLNEKLPDYMVPSLFISLETLPRNPNGKIDRSKLPSPEESPHDLDAISIPPRSELEEVVANIWRDVLQIENVSVHDNFFALGGHSLLAIQVVSRLQEAFNKEVPLRLLFDAPTIADLTNKCEDLLKDAQAPSLPPIKPAPRDGPLPLSMNQEHLWHLDQVIPGTHFFNMPYAYHLSGHLNLDALEKALREMLRRHEALRTVFTTVDGHPVQIIKDDWNFQLPVEDLRAEAPDDSSHRTAVLILEERNLPFDLTVGPLFRTRLVRLKDTEYFLLITMHHIIGDHWSMQIFRKELGWLYNAFSLSEPSPLPALVLQFADFAHWERSVGENGAFNEQLRYWRTQLSGRVPYLEFSRSTRRVANPTFRTKCLPIELDRDLFIAVRARACKENCTPFMLLVAALSLVLFRVTGEREIRLGTLAVNRRHTEAMAAIGHFVNTLVLRILLSPGMTYRELLKNVRGVTLAAYAHQEISFSSVAQLIEQQQGTRISSLCQVLLSYQVSRLRTIAFHGIKIAPFRYRASIDDSELTPTTYPLIFRLRETSTLLTGTVNFKTSLIGEKHMARIVASLERILRRLVSVPGDPTIGEIVNGC